MPFDIFTMVRSMPFLVVGFMLRNKLLDDEQNTKRSLLQFVTAILVYCLSLYLYLTYFHAKGSFGSGEIQKPSLFCFYIAAFSGSFVVIYFCRIIGRISVVNWLGRNSLIIMCVHFPLAQWLNVYVSRTELYIEGGILAKGCISISIVTICLCFGAMSAIIFKRYLPSFTGYKRNFKNI